MLAEIPADIPPLAYRPLSVDPRGAFSCSVPEIDKWFKRCLTKHKNFSNRVTTAHFEGGPEIIAFYALSIKMESARMLTGEDRKAWSSFRQADERFICLNFDYLAVAAKHQGKGVGKLVVVRVIEEFARIASTCGIELMIGSAIDREKFEFYQKLGFQQYGTASQAPQMFLPAMTAMDLVGVE